MRPALRCPENLMRAGALLAVASIWCGPEILCAATISSYEGPDGLLVSQVKAARRIEEDPPAPSSPESAEQGSHCATCAACGRPPTFAVSFTLSNGRAFTLRNVPSVASLMDLSGEQSEAPSVVASRFDVKGDLEELPFFVHDPRTDLILFARRRAGAIEGVVLGIDASEEDSLTVHERQHPNAVSGRVRQALVQIIPQLDPSLEGPRRVESSDQRLSPPSAFSQEPRKGRAEFFLQALHHPSPRGNIRYVTTPRAVHPVTDGVVPEVQEGTLYRGVLSRVNGEVLTVTTWVGEIELKIRNAGELPPTRLFVTDSPGSRLPRAGTSGDTPLDRAKLKRLEIGQFISVYASAKTRLIEWVNLYRRADE